MTVRLIDAEGKQKGIIPTKKAREMALAANLDLVEISASGSPPVCKIMSLGKHLFELTKKKSMAKKNQKNSQVREVKFRPNTDEGDYRVKLKKIEEFITNGDKVKVSVRFKGREVVYQELGREVVDRICKDLADKVIVEQEASMEGRQLIMIIGKRKKNK